MVEYATSSQRSEQPKAKNVNFEPILNPLHVYKIKLQKKKEMGIKNGKNGWKRCNQKDFELALMPLVMD